MQKKKHSCLQTGVSFGCKEYHHVKEGLSLAGLVSEQDGLDQGFWEMKTLIGFKLSRRLRSSVFGDLMKV